MLINEELFTIHSNSFKVATENMNEIYYKKRSEL